MCETLTTSTTFLRSALFAGTYLAQTNVERVAGEVGHTVCHLDLDLLVQIKPHPHLTLTSDLHHLLSMYTVLDRSWRGPERSSAELIHSKAYGRRRRGLCGLRTRH
jgi:hypothetical protein